MVISCMAEITIISRNHCVVLSVMSTAQVLPLTSIQITCMARYSFYPTKCATFLWRLVKNHSHPPKAQVRKIFDMHQTPAGWQRWTSSDDTCTIIKIHSATNWRVAI